METRGDLETKSSNPKDLLAIKRLPLHLIPGPAWVVLASAMKDGALKYGPYNWRAEGVGVMNYIGAAMRHLLAYTDGEDLAQDSGVHHLGHAMSCLAIILDSTHQGNLVDDRPPPAPTAAMMEALKTG